MSAWTYCLQDGKAAPKIVPPRSRNPWKGPGADSEEKHEPPSDTDTVGMDSLKALDPKRPIREADTAESRLFDYLIADLTAARVGAPSLSHRVGCARVFEAGGDAQEPICPLAILRPNVGGCTL
jgi:hypothetical protein